MSPDLPFDVIAQIIDIVGENKDTELLKRLALVSHSFLQICSKHLFATVILKGADPEYRIPSSKKGFVKLLRSRPDVVKYIRTLMYQVRDEYDNRPLSISQSSTHPSESEDDPILLNLLRTISRLNCLIIIASLQDWNTLDSSLTSALLHLMHLPTVNHIDLSYIKNFPMSSLTPCVNLHRLDISDLRSGSPEIVVPLEMMPKIREFHVLDSSRVTTKLLHAKTQDGRPAFNFMDLRLFLISLNRFEDEQIVRYLLQNAKLLEKLHLILRRSLVGLLSPSAHTLKVLDLTVSLYDPVPVLAGVSEELEAMAGHNMLESLSLEVYAGVHNTEDLIGPLIQKVENVLVKPGWSALRQVSFKVSVLGRITPKLLEALQSLPDKYLSQLSKLESVAFSYSVR